MNAKVPILKGNLVINVNAHALLAALREDNAVAAQALDDAVQRQAVQPGDVVRVRMPVDISIGVSDSQAAVKYLQRQVRGISGGLL